jgi:hypothetical protein
MLKGVEGLFSSVLCSRNKAESDFNHKRAANHHRQLNIPRIKTTPQI